MIWLIDNIIKKAKWKFNKKDFIKKDSIKKTELKVKNIIEIF